MEPTSFGALLKRYRLAAGLTQEALAERAKLSARAISDLERGLSRAPHYETLELLTNALLLSAEQRSALLAAARPTLPQASQGTAPAQLLPMPPAALLGREQELAQAADLLQARDVRLLSIIGPGGVGKTRLALELAHSLRAHFADGLAWIDLTVIRDSSLVPQTVAQALGLREAPEQAFAETIQTFLRGKCFLLLLDNIEHVLDAAGFVASLLSHCPRLHIVATSRAPLHLRAEQQLVLKPLTSLAAAALFRERAGRMQLDLDESSALITAICEQLDNVPLAIELAAGHLKALSLPVLLARLTNRLGLLRGGARDLPERQQTMRAAIAWSYNLLPPGEQRAFRMLGIFAGGCTLAALEAIGWEPAAIAAGESLSATRTLVDASLLQVETTGTDGMPRYRMLEVIREYALEQLQVMGEEYDYRQRHARYYAALAEEAEQGGPGQGSRELQLVQEAANGRAALHWAYQHGEVELGLRLATWFGRLWMTRGQMSEASLWLEQMLALDEAHSGRLAPAAVRAKALYWAARLAMHLGRSGRARACAEQALALAKQTGDLADVSGVLAMLGAIALAAANDVQAARYFTESYAAAQQAADPLALGLALLNLGELARKRGELAQATGHLEQALTHARSIDLTWGIANILTLLGHLARQQQDYARARAYYRESLAIYEQLGNATYTAWCLEGIAAMACAEARYQQAARLSGAAAALRLIAQTPLPQAEQDDLDRVILTARAELPEQIFEAEWQSGSHMSQAQAIAYALIG